MTPRTFRLLSSHQVVDRCARCGELDDLSSVAKFELSDEQYAQRGESLHVFKKAHKLGQFSEDAIEAQTSLEQARITRDQHGMISRRPFTSAQGTALFPILLLVTNLLLDSMCLL